MGEGVGDADEPIEVLGGGEGGERVLERVFNGAWLLRARATTSRRDSSG